MTQGNQKDFDEDKFKKLLDEAKHIPKRRDTFLSITNYAHHENMISDILKFFFEDKQHGMKNLWIRALLECVKDFRVECFKKSNVDFSNERIISVEREYLTDEQKRIDLLIVGDTYIISLENKIRANLPNDLVEYAKTINKVNKEVYGGVKIEINMVLSIRNVTHEDAYQEALGNKTNVQDEVEQKKALVEKTEVPNLCNITYNKLLKKVKELLPSYLKSIDNVWLLYLNDFIYTMEGEIGSMDMDFAKFVSENRESIEDMLNKLDDYRKEAEGKAVELAKEVKAALHQESNNGGYKHIKDALENSGCQIADTDPRGWSNFKAREQRCHACCVVDIVAPNKDQVIAVETYVDYDEWHIVLWARKGKLNIAEKLKEGSVEIYDNSYASKTWTGSCDIAKVNIADGTQSVVDKIINIGITNAYKILTGGAKTQTTQNAQATQTVQQP